MNVHTLNQPRTTRSTIAEVLILQGFFLVVDVLVDNQVIRMLHGME